MSKLYLIHERKELIHNTRCIDVVNKKIQSHESKNTQITYKSAWNTFLIWYEEEGNSRSLLDFTPNDSDDFFLWLRKREGVNARVKRKEGVTICKATVKKYAAALTTFWNAIFMEYRVVRFNPFTPELKKYNRGVRSERRPTETIQFNKILELIEAPRTDSPRGLRDRAILAVLFGGGLRRSEAVELNCRDVVCKDGLVTIMLYGTKNGDDCPRRINSQFSRYILEYSEYRGRFVADLSEPFFIDFSKERDIPILNRYSGSSIYKMFKAYAKLVGIPSAASPHSLRKTAIDYLVELEVPAVNIKEFSRHSSLEMVQTYIDKKKSYERDPFKLLIVKK